MVGETGAPFTLSTHDHSLRTSYISQLNEGQTSKGTSIRRTRIIFLPSFHRVIHFRLYLYDFCILLTREHTTHLIRCLNFDRQSTRRYCCYSYGLIISPAPRFPFPSGTEWLTARAVNKFIPALSTLLMPNSIRASLRSIWKTVRYHDASFFSSSIFTMISHPPWRTIVTRCLNMTPSTLILSILLWSPAFQEIAMWKSGGNTNIVPLDILAAGAPCPVRYQPAPSSVRALSGDEEIPEFFFLNFLPKIPNLY